MGPIPGPETSVINQPTLRDNQEEVLLLKQLYPWRRNRQVVSKRSVITQKTEGFSPQIPNKMYTRDCLRGRRHVNAESEGHERLLAVAWNDPHKSLMATLRARIRKVFDDFNSFCFISYSIIPGRDSSVGTAARNGLASPGIKSRWGGDYLHPSRPGLGPTQLPMQWVPGLFPGSKAAGAWR